MIPRVLPLERPEKLQNAEKYTEVERKYLRVMERIQQTGDFHILGAK